MAKRKLRLGMAVLVATAAGCSRGAVGSGSAQRCTDASACHDAIDCTTDTCQEFCEHLPVHAGCPAGTFCDSRRGCAEPPACQRVEDCPDLGPCSLVDCTTAPARPGEPATATCSYRDIDNDGDGQSPSMCGGRDCDDFSDTAYAGARETCNGLDDDCDGEPDEDFGAGMACDGPDTDLCAEGVLVCDDSGTGATCTDSSETSLEICDGSDNDCDGDIDEDGACFSNIGHWCDPAAGSGQDELNPSCHNDTRCLDLDDDTNGICVVFGCGKDNLATGTNEDTCDILYGNDFVCVDFQGARDDTNPDDNICVEKCTPDDTSNPCESPFACTPASTRLGGIDAVCFDLACTAGTDCPVSVTNNATCTVATQSTDCPGAGQFCVLSNDTDVDGDFDIGACSVAGSCNTANGLCAPHSMGTATARIGDPCQADTDCPDGGACIGEVSFQDNNGVLYRSPRNGYCTMHSCRWPDTLTGFACPGGSACYNYAFSTGTGGSCFDSCDPEDATGCRDDLDANGATTNGTPCDVAMGITTNCDWYGDYECLAIQEEWVYAGTGVRVVEARDGTFDGRICDFVAPARGDCTFVAMVGGCAELAPLGNPNGMDCRYPRTGVATVLGADEDGRCLDSTAGTISGPLCPDTDMNGFPNWDIDGICIP